MATVRLDPMTDDEYDAWLEKIVPEYAADNVRSGRWAQAESVALSQASFDELLTNGRDTAGQLLWTVRDEGGSEVGILWVATDRRPRYAFIYDIEMDAARRGEGLGTATLTALEEWCRANGIDSIGLHVFAHNEGAWRLYKRMGYVETDVNMEKRLA